ncbi:MAG: ABC transporter ATP-binding protein [Beijerinckiaceae bacterium]|jgi:zinc/manganese transport system ATP-binding protein
MSAPIRLQDLTVAYDRHAAVHHVSGVFEPGSMTAIVGPNGAGKSTLLKALLGEKAIASGSVDWGGLPLSAVGYLPQVAEIDRSFPLSVGDTVLLGAWRQSGAFGRISREMRERGRAALASVGLDGFGPRPIGALSSGQFRRVLFARLMLQDAEVIILDEPFAAIDARTTEDLLALLEGWHKRSRTIIAVLHDFEQVRAHFPQTLLIARELIAWGDTPNVMSAENLLRARAMSQNWDDVQEICDDAHRHVA